MRALFAFFTLTFAATWSCWYLAARASRGQGALVLLGVFVPAFVALAMTYLGERGAGVVALLKRLVQWQVGVRWYVFAIGFMAAVKLVAAVVHRVALGAWPRFGTTPIVIMLAATLFSTLVFGQAGEEVGWRGYALPRLSAGLGLPWASVLLGIVWAVWHLPLFFFPGADTQGQSFPVYLLQVTALSVAVAWLWMKSGGSLLLTMLLHSAINNTKDIVPSALTGATNAFSFHASPVAWITVTVLWFCAAYFLFDMRAHCAAGGGVWLPQEGQSGNVTSVV